MKSARISPAPGVCQPSVAALYASRFGAASVRAGAMLRCISTVEFVFVRKEESCSRPSEKRSLLPPLALRFLFFLEQVQSSGRSTLRVLRMTYPLDPSQHAA
jgi:hypothetical protein